MCFDRFAYEAVKKDDQERSHIRLVLEQRHRNERILRKSGLAVDECADHATAYNE